MHFILAFFQMLFLNFNFLIYKCWYTLSVAHDINLQSIVLVSNKKLEILKAPLTSLLFLSFKVKIQLEVSSITF